MQKTIIRRNQEPLSLNIHPILNRIYANRGIRSAQELERGLSHLLPFNQLMGIDQAVNLLVDSISKQQKIVVVGDFDADGATSTALAVRALRAFGAQSVQYCVPNRFDFGYGLTPELVQVIKKMTPDLIVTVDNGIANHAGVEEAKKNGIKVIITDHHLPGETLPLADAIVNPNQPGDSFNSKNMAGVGVIFYVMLALRRQLTRINWFNTQSLPEPNMASLLDLVALGTVADVVPLDHHNRIMVYQGLKRIQSGACIPGIRALLELANRQLNRLTAMDLGFVVAPRLNAAGRLDDMSLGIACLLSDDIQAARQMAQTLNQLNEERRALEQTMQAEALSLVKKLIFDKHNLPVSICLFDESWHAGIIGLLASRLKDLYHRPTVIFAVGTDNKLKGSARSIEGLHLRDCLAELSTRYPSLMYSFGGHAMAAGLTIPRHALNEFTKLFNQLVFEKVNQQTLQQMLVSDGELLAEEMTLEIAEILRDAGPFGQFFSEPLFDGIFKIVNQRLVAGKHLKLDLAKEDKIIDAIAFNVDINQWPNYRCQQVHIAYRLDLNEFKGKKKVQFIIESLVEA